MAQVTQEPPHHWLQTISQASKIHQEAGALEKVAGALALLEERGIITRDEARTMLKQYGFLSLEGEGS